MPMTSRPTAVFAFMAGSSGMIVVRKGHSRSQPMSPTAPSIAPVRHSVRPATRNREARKVPLCGPPVGRGFSRLNPC